MRFLSANYMLLFAEVCTKDPELCENGEILCNIFKQKFLMFRFIKLAKLIFFGFTFDTNLSIFIAKTLERKLFCRQINQSRVLFSFPSCDWLYFFQSWHVKK